jgi:hypothetical protein
VRHVGALRVAPVRDDEAPMNDDAVKRSARLRRADDLEIGLALAERVSQILGDVLRRRILVGNCVVDGLF